MLTDFFKLNNSPSLTTLVAQNEFIQLLGISKDLRNLIYEPADLSPGPTHPKLKIKKTSFTNVSFSKTKISNVVFIGCKFEDCLFIGSTIEECEIHNCIFLNTNTYKIKINRSYANPDNFIGAIRSIKQANIGVHLFQQLLDNSKDEGQSKFVRTAEYNFKKWKDNVQLNKFVNHEPYSIGLMRFLITYPLNLIFRLSFGYGLRLRNFVITFLLVFISFFLVNHFKWKEYSLEKKDISIDAFNKDSANNYANFYFTLDATTKLVDSQFQPKSNEGMIWLTIQNISGFILLSSLITIILNRFVK